VPTGFEDCCDIRLKIRESSTYGHSQLKTGHPVRSAIHKQLNGRLVLRWVTTWESLLLYVLRILCLFLWSILVDLPCDSLAKSLGRTCVLSGADPGFRSIFCNSATAPAFILLVRHVCDSCFTHVSCFIDYGCKLL
jgi:hypothetical protein